MLYTNDDGEVYERRHRADPRPGGRVTGAVTAISDITVAKRAEATLREQPRALPAIRRRLPGTCCGSAMPPPCNGPT
ncbi:hypothetical protein AB5I41_07675 [Sphingomonas sp. MMS24-JH45]